jgi:hypothetical protein
VAGNAAAAAAAAAVQPAMAMGLVLQLGQMSQLPKAFGRISGT